MNAAIELYLKTLETKQSYLLFAREWMLLYGFDTILYAMDSHGVCTKLCRATGQSTEPVEQRTLIDITIEVSDYMNLVTSVVDAGYMGLPNMTEPICTANCIDYYSVKLQSGIRKTVMVPGARSTYPAQIRVKNLLVGSSLAEFYRLSR